MHIAARTVMNVIEALHARRAVRAYTSRMVDERSVRSLLAAAVQAPSAVNSQDWSFVVVQDASRLRHYSDRAKEMLLSAPSDPKIQRNLEKLQNPSFNVFYDASTLVVICGSAGDRYTPANCWLAAQNSMLAACEAGLGTCPIGFAIPVLNTPDVKHELRIPADVSAVAPIIVGYPSGSAPAVPRGEPRVLSWIR